CASGRARSGSWSRSPAASPGSPAPGGSPGRTRPTRWRWLWNGGPDRSARRRRSTPTGSVLPRAHGTTEHPPPGMEADDMNVRTADQGARPDAAVPPELTHAEILRYSRHLTLPDVGLEGQRKLKASRVLLVGAGGLGSPLALYLAAAGVGTLGIVDFDRVDETNLHRQVLHGQSDIGRPKLDSARDRLAEINPHVKVEPHPVRLTSQNALEIVREYDGVVDGPGNLPPRYLVNDACVLTGRPSGYGSIFRFDGQVSVFGVEGGPCYRCLFREPPPPGLVPSCAEGGVLGVLPGIIGSLQ